MGLNKVKQGSQMYQGWITHTWNPLAGKCLHNCSYCSTNRLRKRFPIISDKYSGKPRVQKSEMKTNLGKDNYIFIVGQNDLFADDVPNEVIVEILDYCKKFNNKYLFQTKNPVRMLYNEFPINSILGTTIETNRFYPEIMNKCPLPEKRSYYLGLINSNGLYKTFVTIEPIMSFDLKELIGLIKFIQPSFVNIGADSGNNNLPEPSKEKILQLIVELEKFTKVKLKSNLNRLL